MDPVIQIANMVTTQGPWNILLSFLEHPYIFFSGDSKPFIRNVFTLKECSHIIGSQILSFDDERDLLQKWRDFVEEADPDLIIGYNISNFDFPYLMDRAKALKLEKFPYLGRMTGKTFLTQS